MPLILAVRELCGEVTANDMQMIADINRIILNLAFMNRILKDGEQEWNGGKP